MPATKDQIADTFSRHVERFGFGKASVEDVAAELGISKRTVYQYFASKRDLYGYVVDRIAVTDEARLRQALASESSYRAKMLEFLRLVVGGMRGHIAETTKADWMQEFEVAYDAMARAYGAIGVELVREGAAAGEFEMSDAELANGLIAAMITHYGVLVREDPAYEADERLIAAIMRMLGGPVAAEAARRGKGRARTGKAD